MFNRAKYKIKIKFRKYQEAFLICSCLPKNYDVSFYLYLRYLSFYRISDLVITILKSNLIIPYLDSENRMFCECTIHRGKIHGSIYKSVFIGEFPFPRD